jgi:hemoglobin
MRDITNHQDIVLMVDSFYAKVKEDELLQPIFAHVDWAHHLPVMYDFWSSIILGAQSFQRDPFQKHIPLGLQPKHFNHWLKLFHHTIDEHFSGQHAEDVKRRADSIAVIFQHKLGLLAEN